MMKQKLFFSLILTFFLSIFYGQDQKNQFDDNGKRHGYWSKNYPDKNLIRYSGTFNHGKEIDTFKYYTIDENKSILSAVKIFNPNNDKAKVIFMTSKGKTISEGIMEGKTYIGKWVYYHQDSKNIMIEEYFNNDGQLDGVRTVFYDNAIKAEMANYKNGKLNGKSEWYSKEDKLTRVSYYLNDELNGKTIYYDNFGNITAEGNYKEGKKNDVWKYYKSGQLQKKIDHTNNVVLFKREKKKR